MRKLPLARYHSIVVQEIGKEILIYDLDRHKAFNLNENLSIVYQACNGATDFEELKLRHNFTDDVIYFALNELKSANLIELNDNEADLSPLAGMSRREAIKKVGLGTMIALPLLSALVAPTAAHAASTLNCNTEQSCGCIYAATDTTSTFCTGADISFGDCGTGCPCYAFANSQSCSPDGDSKFCLGSCTPSN